MHLLLKYTLVLLLISLVAGSLQAQGQSTDFNLGESLTEHHVPLTNSQLYLDTATVDFRPLMSFQGGDWTSEKSEASFLVMVFQKSDTPSAELQALLDRIDTEMDSATPLTLKQTKDWNTTLTRSSYDDAPTGSYSLRSTRNNDIIYLTANQITEEQLRSLLGSLSLSQAVTNTDPFAQLPLSLKLPANFPLKYTGKVPMLGYAFGGEGETMVGLDDGAMMSDLLALDEASIRSQVGEEATIRIDGDDKLVFGYEQKDGNFQVFGIRGIKDKSVALMGQGVHSDAMEATLLALLEALEER